jgi:hypothetical protein
MSSQAKKAMLNKCSKHRQVKPVIGGTPPGQFALKSKF